MTCSLMNYLVILKAAIVGESWNYDDRGHKRLYRPMNQNKNKGLSPLMKVLIVLGISFVLIQIIGSMIIGFTSALNGETGFSFGSYTNLYIIEIILSLIIALVCYLIIKK